MTRRDRPQASESATEPGQVEALLAYLAASPSPYHAAANAAATLDDAGFTALDPAASWDGAPSAAYVMRGGSLVAWLRTASAAPHAPFRLIGAHTDSPNLRIKPRPDTGALGWRQLGVEVYGGALINSWLDRDLGISGRAVLTDGATRLVTVDRPIARVPQLAIHLDRDVNERGLQLDKQQHLTPVWGLGQPTDGGFVRWLAGELDVDREAIRSYDLMFHDLTVPSLLGIDDELIASARLDNLCSSWCAIEALRRSAATGPASDTGQMIVLFDHEEVGSSSTTGAGGPLLEHVLDRVVAGAGGGLADRARLLAGSRCLSADMAHAVHPNYGERHEPGHRPLPNGGPVLKVNVNQKYATDAVTAADLIACCDRAGVPHQVFVSRNNVPCGSTIGPITATRLGIATADVGIAQLSMHSARELCGAHDPAMLVAAMVEFLRTT